jgi:hypothetical protein
MWSIATSGPRRSAIAQRSSSVLRSTMPQPEGFTYLLRGSEVVIRHRGRPATTLRGRRAAQFLEDVEVGDPQELMARLTGNFRRGNERQAQQHPRNLGR